MTNPKPRTAPGHVGDMMIRRMLYDRMRYKVINEYIEKRREGLHRAKRLKYDRLEREAAFCEQRGDFWLEVVRRDINKDLDSMVEAIRTDETIMDDFFRESATDDGKRTAFSKSPDFLSTFDIFFRD